MWGELDNQKLTNIKESFCLGEACLIFEYGKAASRTVAFRTAADLRKAHNFFKTTDRNYILEVLDKEVLISTPDIKITLKKISKSRTNN